MESIATECASHRSSVDDVKKQITGLMRRLDVDDCSLKGVEYETSTFQGSDEGYALRRFLLETESVLDESPASSPPSDTIKPDQIETPGPHEPALPLFQPEATSLVRVASPKSRTSMAFPESDLAISHFEANVRKQLGPLAEMPAAEQHKVFGVTLQHLYLRDGSIVPLFVLRCIELIETHGLKIEGIYNVPGGARSLTDIQTAVDRGMISHNNEHRS